MSDGAKVLCDQEVDSNQIGTFSTKFLIDFAVAKDRKMKDVKAETDLLKAEIQRRAERILEEKNIKFTKFFGTTNELVKVQVAQSIELLNLPELMKIIGEELMNQKITKVVKDPEYKMDAKFKTALTALVLGDYVTDMTVEEVLNQSGIPMDTEQKSLLLKKLKGTYDMDKKALMNILKIEETALDVDVELYLIYRIKNWELIRAFFPIENIKELKEAITCYVLVDETPKIGLEYES